MLRLTIRLATCAAALLMAVAPVAEACTRAVYLGPEDRVLTGRSMDWKLPMASNLWVFPRGMERDGAAGDRSATWTSRYGSLAMTGYDIATADGMNEAGLNVSPLWEVEATYPEDDGITPTISLSVFPQYLLDRQLAIREYWEGVNPREFMPGTVRATDRFVRASFYINAVEQTADPRRTAAAVFSVIRQTSVPWGISIADQPSLSTTRWRIVADQTDRRYYVESILSPSVFWVDRDKLDFAAGTGVLKLDLGVDIEHVLSGEASASFVQSEPFAFQQADQGN
ncbi:MAG: linear amide C-N hydrolase [Roseovarius sp.]